MTKFKDNRIVSLDQQVSSEPHLTPQLPFSMNFIAQKGRGKTTVLLNLLLNENLLNSKFNATYIVSHPQEKWIKNGNYLIVRI